MLSPQWLDELRARVTLSSVVMRTVKLQRAGREWKACCPFHNEKSPSFTVNDAKGFYHCFGCGAHGDVIRWMTDQRGLQFMDAVKELAAEAGLEVPAPDPRTAQQAEKRASLIDVTEAAQQWFVHQLRGPQGAAAREYLASRGFSDSVVREFGFGYAPEGRQALKAGLAQYDEAMLVESGMRIETEQGEHYDRFRERLMLPIQDARGRVIAFGGRILDKRDGVAKYLNSPDTPLFDKGRTLYNLHRAGPASRQSGRMVVVEGYMDVIALANAGITDAVAPLGTALTERQIELLWRMVDNPILCFDGDAAGQRAALRAAQRALPLMRPGKFLQFVILPKGLDPDDVIRLSGVERFNALLADTVGLLQLLWRFETENSNLNTPDGRAQFEDRLFRNLDAITDRTVQKHYRSVLSQSIKRFFWQPWKAQKFLKNAETDVLEVDGRIVFRPFADDGGKRTLKGVLNGAPADSLLNAVVAGLIRFPDQIDRHADTLSEAAERDAKVAELVNPLLDMAEMLEHGGGAPISGDTGPLAAPDKSRFAFLSEATDPEAAREDLAEAVSLLVERPALEAALAAATARFETDPEGAFAEQQRLLKRKLEFEARLGQMATLRAARRAGLGQHDTGQSSAPETAGEQETG